MGDIQFKRHMNEVRPLPGRAENSGKRTSPWLDRFVLIGFSWNPGLRKVYSPVLFYCDGLSAHT